ncbi:MAG TPA: HEAT repeat domain-containing protein [Candidatus Bilamarchaeum sp.]|nr:HEAT repeat domain-containing protein [Candidatus Bilamarchaeum sp.]
MAELPPHLRHLAKDTARASHLRVIAGGKKEKNPFKARLLTGAALLSLAIAGAGTAINLQSRLNNQALVAAGRPLYYSPVFQQIPSAPSVKAPEFSGLNTGAAPKEKMENLSTPELIGKLLPVNPHGLAVGPEGSRNVIEHNYASLLLEMRGNAAVPELVRALASERGEFRRENIAFILGRIGNPGALPALRERAEKDESAAVKAAAAEAIERIEKR